MFRLTMKIVVLALSNLALLTSCSAKTTLDAAAKAFCDVHDLKNWQDISKDSDIAKFNEIVHKRVLQALKTDEFIALVNELSHVEFYKLMYPTAKKKIQTITGKEWQCPAYEKFYSLNFVKEEANSKPIEFCISKQGFYSNNGKQFSLTDEAISSTLKNTDKQETIIIKLDSGESEESLMQLMSLLAKYNIENIKVVSE